MGVTECVRDMEQESKRVRASAKYVKDILQASVHHETQTQKKTSESQQSPHTQRVEQGARLRCHDANHPHAVGSSGGLEKVVVTICYMDDCETVIHVNTY